MSTITFLDQTFNRDDLSEAIISYIETYNRVVNAARNKDPDDRDYDFRMNQALQMFGNEEVIAGIELLIIADQQT